MIETLTVLSLLGVAFISFQYAWWRPTIDYSAPRILMYHMISRQKPKTRFNKLRVAPEEFERQVRWLRENGWNFLWMSEIHEPIVKKSVVITFDDGYRDNLLAADPVLRKYGAKATLYLVVDRHDRDWSSYKKSHHSDGELMHEPKLLDEDVGAMLDSGRWELGAHTLTHANLENIDDRQRHEEIVEGRNHLKTRFDEPVDTFAYPFGIYSVKDADYVRRAGYSSAVTTKQGVSVDTKGERFSLKRIKVSGHDGLYSFRLRLRTGKCRARD